MRCKNRAGSILALLTYLSAAAWLPAQSINSGTVNGTVIDPSGSVIAGATVTAANAITGYKQSVTTDASGVFHLVNVPLNSYRVTVAHAGFAGAAQDLVVRTTVPMTVDFSLKLATEAQTVNVEATASQVESDPSAHQDVDQSSLSKLHVFSPGSGLSEAITQNTGAVAGDANGFFHPAGDHAQATYEVDGQSISDQQSKVFSTQIPVNALQGMELITGSPSAEYGDKSSLVINATTRSGLGAKPFGSLELTGGSFGTYTTAATYGFGNTKFGNFTALNFTRSGHFLDTPEFLPIHDIGNNSSIFDRVDYQPNGSDALHLNLFLARNWFQIPNSYDQLSQDQKQRVLTWNIAPGYQHTFNASTLLTVNAFTRRDQFNYYPSRDAFSDTPVTVAQQRFLTNVGAKADLSVVSGHNDWKFGTQIQQTRLAEAFSLGVTDPGYNPVCLDGQGNALLLSGVTNPANCPAGAQANPNLQRGIVPYDLSRGGRYFAFHGSHNINQAAFYANDTMHFGNLTVNAGVRFDYYNGLSSTTGTQPRLGLSYLFKPTGTVLRAAYARTFETPFNENLILSSGTGAGGLAENVFGAASTPIQPGRRNQFNTGFQQAMGRYLVLDVDYFWKYTHNAYDFSVLFNTPITFPISWHNSKLDGVTARVSSINIHGFQAYVTAGHTRARYFGPEVGGLIALGGLPGDVFRIDHDQALQTTSVLRYQHGKTGPWFDFTWRYESGQVVSGVPDVAAALNLTANQQADIGFSCGGVFATRAQAITSCNGAGRSMLLTLPQTGAENNDHNPDRVKPRNLFNLGVGTDNLFRSESGARVTTRFTVENLTNQVALYNFLSTFSGTHFVPPRTYQVTIGYVF